MPEEKHQTILVFRWLVVLVSVLLMVYGLKGLRLTSPGYLLAVFLFASNLALGLAPRRLFEQRRFIASIFGMDVALVSLVIYLAGEGARDLYLLYFFVVFIALPARSMAVSVMLALFASVLYTAVAYKTSGAAELLQASFLIKLPFFFVIAVFGSLVTRQAAELKRQEEENRRLSQELKIRLDKARKSKEKLYDDLLMLYNYNEGILNSLACGIMVVDLSGIITAFNRAAAAITGLRSEDVLSTPIHMNRTLGNFGVFMKNALSKPATRRLVSIVTPSGEKKIIGVSTSLLKHKKGQTIGVIAIFADLTEVGEAYEATALSGSTKPGMNCSDTNALAEKIAGCMGTETEESGEGTDGEHHNGTSQPSGDGHQPNVLVADDDASVRDFYRGVLEELGCRVLLAKDGEEAIRKTVGGDVDLLILEIKMPLIDGIHVMEHISKTNPGLPIIVSTSYTDMENHCTIEDSNMVAYLVKPVNIFELQRSVEEALRGSRGEKRILSRNQEADERPESDQSPRDQLLAAKRTES